MMKMKKMMLASRARFVSTAKNKSLRPAFLGQWLDAVRGLIAQTINEV
ncbi:hypothetical protein [Bradyrhizobium sp. CCBAU 11357]|nr:hypothetical protein [Bradyrhizobium sp. CCBAU 11357]